MLPENGFNIARALVGSEGTCVNVLHAKTRLITNPTHRLLVVLGFENIFEAADSVPQLLPLEPIAMEGLDYGIIGGLKRLGLRLDDIAELPAGNAWLMVEFGATSEEEVRAMAGRLVAATPELVGRPSMRLVEGPLMQRLWSIRETGASATSRSEDPDRPDPVVGWEDAAVEPAKLGSYLREFAALVERFRLSHQPLWPLRRWLHTRAYHLRLKFAARSERLAQVSRGSRQAGGEVWRLALGRAW